MGYVPLKWQWKFHAAARRADKPDGPVKIGVGGARGPGKSHAVFSQAVLDDCMRVKGLKGLFLRQTGRAAQESFEDLIQRVLKGKVEYEYSRHQSVLTLSNGSRLVLGGFYDDRDIDRYIGIEYDFIAIEELNQLTEDRVLKLLGSMRTSKENWRPRLYASFNPGGIGHAFVKKLFVDPHAMQKEDKTTFIPSTYRDNPYLNPEYIDYLENLPGQLGKAWRDGSFDIFEGQYFQEWNRERHVVVPFKIPEGFKRFRAYDHGRTAPACMKWYALDYDGRVWVYRELYVKGMNVDQIAAKVNTLSEGETYTYSVADPSIFARTGFVDAAGGQTIAESFARHGITFIPGSNRRVDGWSLMHKYLYWDKETIPKILYFNTCFDSIRTIPTLIHDDKKPEDLNTNGEDHAADTDRYFLMTIHESKTAPPKTKVERMLAERKKQTDYNPLNFGSTMPE